MTKCCLLTKSRFKVGYKYPLKLYFTANPEYGNTKLDNAFLEALGEDAFQAGELAKVYHQGGVEVTELDMAKSTAFMSKLFEMENVTIYETLIRLARRLGSIETIKTRAPSHYKYLTDKNLLKEIYKDKAS
jgi:hypothetical protein